MKSNWNVWKSSFDDRVWVAVRPSSRNYYSCDVSRAGARAVSNAILDCAARVELESGGSHEAQFWKPNYESAIDVGYRSVIAVESCAVGVRLTISGIRRYSVTLDLPEALEFACRLWVSEYLRNRDDCPV